MKRAPYIIRMNWLAVLNAITQNVPFSYLPRAGTQLSLFKGEL